MVPPPPPSAHVFKRAELTVYIFRFALELKQVEVNINKVEDIVRNAALQLQKYRLVRSATEDRLHKRIAELEVAMLTMFSQTALHAGVEDGRLIDPPLRASSPSRARLRGYSPGALPTSPVPPVCLSQTLPLSTPRPAGHEFTHVGSPYFRLSSNQQTVGLQQSSTSPLSPLSRSHLSEQQRQPNVGTLLPKISSPRSTSESPPPVHLRQSPGDSWAMSPAAATSISRSVSGNRTGTTTPTAAADDGKGEHRSAGIGLLLEKRAEVVTVKGIATGGFADNSGLIRMGDILESVNNQDVRGLSLEEIHDIIRQESLQGTPIRLQLVRQSLSNTGVRFIATVSKSTLSGLGAPTSPQMSPVGAPVGEEGSVDQGANPKQRRTVCVTRDEHGGVGLGFFVNQELEGALITKVESGRPAARALLQKGQIIHQIDNKTDVATMTADEITSLLRGPPVTDVLLVISDGGTRWDHHNNNDLAVSRSSSSDAEVEPA